MTVVIADGQEIELNEKPGITCMVAPRDMVIEAPEPNHHLTNV